MKNSSIRAWIYKRLATYRLLSNPRLPAEQGMLGLLDANNLLTEALASKELFFATKIGANEKQWLRPIVAPLLHGYESSYKNVNPQHAYENGRCPAGVYPFDLPNVIFMMEEVVNSFSAVDLLLSWGGHYDERLLCSTLRHYPIFANGISAMNLWHCIEDGLPVAKHWLSSCTGKKILLVTPFQESIRHALKLHDNFYSGFFRPASIDYMRPPTNYEYFCVDANDSVSSMSSLRRLKAECSNYDFDIALLGCGVYSLPLGSFIARKLKKKVVNLGGDLHHNFGITGGRWRDRWVPVQERCLHRHPISVLECERPPETLLARINWGDRYW